MALNVSWPAYIYKNKVYSVPYLQFNFFVILNFDGPGGELDSDSHIVLLGEVAFDISDEHGRFADS